MSGAEIDLDSFEILLSVQLVAVPRRDLRMRPSTTMQLRSLSTRNVPVQMVPLRKTSPHHRDTSTQCSRGRNASAPIRNSRRLRIEGGKRRHFGRSICLSSASGVRRTHHRARLRVVARTG